MSLCVLSEDYSATGKNMSAQEYVRIYIMMFYNNQRGNTMQKLFQTIIFPWDKISTYERLEELICMSNPQP